MDEPSRDMPPRRLGMGYGGGSRAMPGGLMNYRNVAVEECCCPGDYDSKEYELGNKRI